MKNDLQKRVISGGIAFLLFLIPLWQGGVFFHMVIGALALIATGELLRMHRLAPNSIEGILTMLATFLLTLPLDRYLKFLPLDGNYTAYTVVMFIMLGSTVFNPRTYTYSEAVFPIASSFYVGIGFHNLIAARTHSLDMVFFALFIVWMTDIGAYLVGSRYGRRKLMPTISPNKTVEGALGGILSAVVTAAIFLLLDPNLRLSYPVLGTLVLVVFFSVFAQLGDLVESGIKRRFGVKDSSNLIPGHGGILDRFDSMIFVFPLMHLFGLF
ncbi:phosphatidate cytidylyltransferase [Streptococcus sp. DD13]|uniref:phosphatidate cytidylyltransferase n=1 Tax=Streptococcus sp. DD13 TaxID=1777881 RepID=UPI0007990D23|nr:phosphatidate cytidylyltransferase [Streptococcus sp. DD13]KXT77749.1 Phosphatidate cytidylyltransferase [Streptococcus sp. DD13]